MRFLLAAMTLIATPALAQPACTLPDGWAKPTIARAAVKGDALRYALKPGQTVNLGLARTVTFAAKPGRAPKPNSYAGIAALDIAKAGTVAVSLSNRAYVDLIRDGKTIASTSHREGCGGVRKTVNFAVTPGRYLIQLADAPEARVRMSIAQ